VWWTMNKMLFASVVALMVVSTAHAEEHKTIACQGRVEWLGNNDYAGSRVGDEKYITIHNCEWYLLRLSLLAQKILKVCPLDSRCYAKARVIDYQEEMAVTSILQVLKLK
jgi:hypothetical protein